MMRKHFRIRRIVIGLAFAAIVAPAAQAQTYYVDGGPAPVSYVTPLQADGMRLQAMANAYQSQAASRAATNLGPLDPWAYAAIHKSKSLTPAPVVTTTTSNSFSWGDAGIGALFAFGVAVMLLTAVVVSRRRRSGLANA